MSDRVKGVYKIMYRDSSECVKYWNGEEWQSFAVTIGMTDEELDFLFIYPVLID